MFILEKPYVSEYLIDTIVKNDWTILHNATIEQVDIEADDLHLITTEKAIINSSPPNLANVCLPSKMFSILITLPLCNS